MKLATGRSTPSSSADQIASESSVTHRPSRALARSRCAPLRWIRQPAGGRDADLFAQPWPGQARPAPKAFVVSMLAGQTLAL